MRADLQSVVVEHREPLTFNRFNPVTEAVERVTTNGHSTIHKTLRLHHDVSKMGYPPGELPTDLNYWRREALIYQSDVSEWLAPHGVSMPALIDVIDEPSRITLVLEDVAGTPGIDADDEALISLAGRWGSAQSSLVDRRPEEWLPSEWLRSYFDHRPDVGSLYDDDEAWAHPAVAAVIDPALRAGLRRMWEDRWWCCDQLALLPTTFGHHDLWPGNVIFRPSGTPAVLDWSFCGVSPFGFDMVVMIFDNFLDLLIDVDRLPTLERGMTSAWLDAVANVLDPTIAQLGVHLSAARFAWLPVRMIGQLTAGRAGNVYLDESVSIDAEWAGRAPVFERMVEWHEAARAALD